RVHVRLDADHQPGLPHAEPRPASADALARDPAVGNDDGGFDRHDAAAAGALHPLPAPAGRDLGRGRGQGMSAVPGRVTTGRARFRRGLSDRQLALALILPTAILLGVFEVYPFVIAVRDSFYYLDLVGSAPDKFVGLANYTSVLSDPETHAAFLRTF